MTISLCKHGFPIQPPLGSMASPGDCTGCGLTWAASQIELERQAERVRLATAHEGRCEFCAKSAVVFQFQREQAPWEETEPAVRWLCIPCWGQAKTTAEETGFDSLADVFDNGTDDQLARFVFGGAR
ncbi:hypothetical protein [Streptomyces sp. NRRL F-5630]|uniref:hypothetical protein n=1 Tax=Streptomyces sp. NRRL F-5630 TaxID=1463864 RepID=UPI003EBBD9FA